MTKPCQDCGVSFDCGAHDAPGHCWCAGLPAIMPVDPAVSCRCPACLKVEIRRRLDAFVKTVTPATAASCGATRHTTDAPPVEGIDFDVNESGLLVFTAWYHLKRGYCCDNGCVNCPY